MSLVANMLEMDGIARTTVWGVDTKDGLTLRRMITPGTSSIRLGDSSDNRT